MGEYFSNINWLSYFFYNILIALICVGFYFLMRNKSEKVKHYTILSLLIFGFFLHFTKLLIPSYQNNMPESLIEITLSTPCSISALSFPFIYMSKNQKLKDYMVVFGMISGVATLLFPLDIQGLSMFNIDVIRFYTAHLIILLVPLYIYIFKLHTLTNKWAKHTIIVFLIVLLIIVINNELFNILVLKQTGQIEQLGQYFK
jgi:hypothetical protein